MAPLLILLIFSVIQVGITFGDWMAVNNAARAGARQAAVFGEGSPTNWSSSCRGVVETARLAAAGVSIAPSVSNGVAVTVRDGGVNAQTLGCAVGMGAASTTVSASEASRPCLGSGEGSRSQDIRVDVEVNPYRIQIPFGINIDTRIAATGVFRCEFK